MKEVDERATRLLLSDLDNEIDRKCKQLQERHQEVQLKRKFFSSCAIVFVLFILQAVFNVFNINLLIMFFVFQSVALLILVPIVLNLNKRHIG